ncbi:MAG TPA: pitrilysin family protein [Thermomicrobiales bacterium]|nr:pitrilysin family protein [Thermomicrobiales bacterium]
MIARSQRHLPIGSFWIWYRVGGRNEVPGITGVSHWAEHMLFKGTERYGKGAIFRAITAAGGSLNGFTWIDYTAYFETLPIDRIDLAFDIEADRMVNARFDADEVDSERSVIISERQGNENQPTFLLAEEMSAAAFKAHAYGHGVIGFMSDLEAMTRDDLYSHYQTYYRPNNAVAVFVGDLDANEAVERIADRFGVLERGPEIPVARTAEPEQFGERRVTIRRPAPNRVLQIGHRVIPGSHDDAPALMVADAILSGGKAMGFGGGAAMGRSSRLYRRLVTTELASSAGSSFSLTIDPYLFGLSATLRPDSDPEHVEDVLLGEVERLASEPVPAEEFERALKQIRAQHAYGQQSVSSKAYLLGSLAMVAPERSPESLIGEFMAVTPDDVQRVVASYLVEQRRTVGWLIPTTPSGDEGNSTGAGFARPAGYVPDSDDVALDETMPGIVETRLANGLRVVTLDRVMGEDGGPVVMRVRVPGGSSADGDRRGVARFTADMLTRGSGGRTSDELAEELDGIGASISAGVGRETFDIVSTSMLEDVDHVAGLLASALLRPDFPDDQMQVVRGQILSGLRQAQNDSRAEAEHVMRGMIYPEGHPYRDRVSGTEETVAAMTRDDLASFHNRAIRPSTAIVAIAGSISHAEAIALVERHLGSWEGDTPPVEVADPVPIPQAVRETRELPGKTQADIAIGSLALSRGHPDYDGLNVANLILGRLGLMGRLGESVRERQGMAYYAYSALEVGIGAGQWSARAGVNPSNIDRAIDTILAEVRQFLDGGPTDEEFSDAMGYLTGSMPLGMETAGAISALIADIAFFDLGNGYLRQYRSRIKALTPEHLTESMRRYVDPDRVAIAIVRPAGE